MNVCEKCLYWQPGDLNKNEGICRVNPPILHPLGGKQNNNIDRVVWSIRGFWPKTKDDDWCGAYQQRSAS